MRLGLATLASLTLGMGACLPEAPDATVEQHASAVTAADVYTRLTVRLEKNGRAEVIHAVEKSGRLKQRDRLSGDFVTEVSAGPTVLATESFENPFEERSFAADGHEEQTSEADSVEVSIGIPGLGLGRRDYDVRVHKLIASTPERRLDPQSFARMKARGALRVFAQVDATKTRAVLSRGARLIDRGVSARP